MAIKFSAIMNLSATLLWYKNSCITQHLDSSGNASDLYLGDTDIEYVSGQLSWLGVFVIFLNSFR